jgi:hypothetical protein
VDRLGLGAGMAVLLSQGGHLELQLFKLLGAENCTEVQGGVSLCCFVGLDGKADLLTCREDR